MRKNDIAVALALLTRLPLPRLGDDAFADQARSSWAFPLVGLVVGVLSGTVGLVVLALGLPGAVAAGVVTGVQVIVTGAMHEDGLADTADGLWGGWTRERRLEIMKDSAIGTYGVLALILSVGLRWIALTGLMSSGIGPVIAAAALSRAVLPAVMHLLPHARASGLSHRVGVPDGRDALIALGLGAVIAAIAAGPGALLALGLAGVGCAGLARVAMVRIGGQTGDILGASQQIVEIVVLLTLLGLVST